MPREAVLSFPWIIRNRRFRRRYLPAGVPYIWSFPVLPFMASIPIHSGWLPWRLPQDGPLPFSAADVINCFRKHASDIFRSRLIHKGLSAVGVCVRSRVDTLISSFIASSSMDCNALASFAATAMASTF